MRILFLICEKIPIGLAGLLLVNGEHRRGELYVPLAMTEETVVASFKRGMQLLRESGGVSCHDCCRRFGEIVADEWFSSHEKLGRNR